MESRNLFATMTGVVFQDFDGDGIQASHEPGLAGWTVFRETIGNLNGRIDPGELVGTTDENGVYELEAGDGTIKYTVDVIPPRRTDTFQWEATTRTYRADSLGFAPIGFKQVDFTDLTPVGGENSIVTMELPPRWDSIEGGGAGQKMMAADGAGNYVMTWNDPSTTSERVYFQRFHSDGTAKGAPVLAFSQPLLGPSMVPSPPRVVMSEDGSRFAIGFQAKVVMYTGQGAPLSSGTTLSGNIGDLSMDKQGNLVTMFWDSKGRNGGMLSFQRFLPTGALNGKKVLVYDAVNLSTTMSVAMAPTGGSFAVAYAEAGVGSFLQRFDAKGAKVGTAIRLAESISPLPLVMNSAGTIAVSYLERAANNIDYETVFRRFLPSGASSGPETRLVLPSGSAVSMTMDSQGAISWASVNTQGVTGLAGTMAEYRHNILLGRVYPDGSSSEPITANTTWEGQQTAPTVVNLGSGGLLVSWLQRVEDPRTSIITQRFSVQAPLTLASASGVDSVFSAPMIEDFVGEDSELQKRKLAGRR